MTTEGPQRPSHPVQPYGSDHEDLDGKVLAALERVAQSFRTLQWQAAREHRLTPLQLQVLVQLLSHRNGVYASGLAKVLGVTRATASEAVSSLLAKGLVERRPSPRDRRRLLLALTTRGRQVALQAAAWGEAVRAALQQVPREGRAALLLFLMRLIAELQRAGVVTVARMCITCRFFRPDVEPGSPRPHFCALLGEPLAVEALRVDCPEHQPAVA
ncbi:MAG: helix-turn-helix domain-containing protein [Dehalococcoidia bacterium]|nr:helix-turn-helix domain-containing protein [Dehalococcoidia bacterium]MDW8008296.1 MarR family transcriptional regulator [Chloroflexota bacterium]